MIPHVLGMLKRIIINNVPKIPCMTLVVMGMILHFNQQCSLDATYNSECPGFYLAMCDQDPIYSPGCVGCDTAYFNYHCSLDSR